MGCCYYLHLLQKNDVTVNLKSIFINNNHYFGSMVTPFFFSWCRLTLSLSLTLDLTHTTHPPLISLPSLVAIDTSNTLHYTNFAHSAILATTTYTARTLTRTHTHTHTSLRPTATATDHGPALQKKDEDESDDGDDDVVPQLVDLFVATATTATTTSRRAEETPDGSGSGGGIRQQRRRSPQQRRSHRCRRWVALPCGPQQRPGGVGGAASQL